MIKALAVGLLGALCVPTAAYATTTALTGELGAFLRTISDGAELAPRQYAAQLNEIRSRSGRRTVVPTLNVSAGRLDADSCLYQLRIDLRWTIGGADGDPELGGRSLIQKAPCATLADEVVAVALYEISALRRRLQDGGRFATNQERDQVIASARRAAQPPDDSADAMTAVTIAGRVNLRASPSLAAPVLAKLAPASVIQVATTPDPDWYQMRGQPGFVHASALRSVHPLVPAEPAEELDAQVFEDGGFTAEVGAARLIVRDQPSSRGRMVSQLRPGTRLRLVATDQPGWYALVGGAGYVAASGLQRIVRAAYRGAPDAAAISAP